MISVLNYVGTEDDRREQAFAFMKHQGGCSPECQLFSQFSVIELTYLVRHIAPGATKPDDVFIDEVASIQSGHVVQQRIVEWLRGLHGVDQGSIPAPADSVAVPLVDTSEDHHPPGVALDEAAQDKAEKEDGRAEGPDYEWWRVC